MLIENRDQNWKTALVTFVAGCCIGGFLGSTVGGMPTPTRKANKFVSREEYDQTCDRLKQISTLYFAERKRHEATTRKYELTLHQLERMEDQEIARKDSR
jgi:hypothetical protein